MKTKFTNRLVQEWLGPEGMGGRQMAGWKGANVVHVRLMVQCIIGQAMRRGKCMGVMLADVKSAYDMVNRLSMRVVMGEGRLGKVWAEVEKWYEMMVAYVKVKGGLSRHYKVVGCLMQGGPGSSPVLHVHSACAQEFRGW